MPSWPIDMPAYGRLLRDFCEKLGVGSDATLVGNSMGGLVAAEAVLRRAEPLQTASSSSPPPASSTPGSPTSVARPRRSAWSTFGRPFGAAARFFVTHPRARYAMFRFAIRYPGRLRKELLWEQMASGVPCPGFADAFDAVLEYDARDRLEEIEIPTMIVWGTDDWVIPSAAAHSYHRRIPNSQLEIFEHTGHVPQLERPARFNALLDEFLAA